MDEKQLKQAASDFDLLARFRSHQVNYRESENLKEIRERCRMLAGHVQLIVPAGRELSLALTHLEEVMFWANAGIARASKECGEEPPAHDNHEGPQLSLTWARHIERRLHHMNQQIQDLIAANDEQTAEIEAFKKVVADEKIQRDQKFAEHQAALDVQAARIAELEALIAQQGTNPDLTVQIARIRAATAEVHSTAAEVGGIIPDAVEPTV